MRNDLVEETTRMLHDAEFEVSDTCNIRPKSFDLVARRGRLVLLVKVLLNIDSFDPSTANEMKLLSRHLDALSLLVGRKSRDHELEDSVLHLRHGVPAVSLGTAHDYLVEGVPPLVYMGPGGLYVNLDGDLLADIRDEHDLSLGQIADELGVSRRSVSKYEDGMDATLEVALRLEEMFDQPLVSPVDPLSEFDPEPETREVRPDVDVNEDEKTVFRLLRSAGFNVLPTSKAPFRAVSRSERTMLTGTSHHAGDVVKRARLMSSISEVARTESIYVVDEPSARDAVDDTVIIEVDELEEVEGSDELLDEVHERKTS